MKIKEYTNKATGQTITEDELTQEQIEIIERNAENWTIGWIDVD